ncbi:hypothetical protein AYI68_g5618 [Smittium mucronatum]|uniref:Uncharacterized protein n=1 Tax=Smittium mucronatum TaxID=133383 RepID=A0A1R0GTT8_9FUNG|nr:hypothetical protein AYI68_g5618 [Smittium mucronatum]
MLSSIIARRLTTAAASKSLRASSVIGNNISIESFQSNPNIAQAEQITATSNDCIKSYLFEDDADAPWNLKSINVTPNHVQQIKLCPENNPEFPFIKE